MAQREHISMIGAKTTLGRFASGGWLAALAAMLVAGMARADMVPIHAVVAVTDPLRAGADASALSGAVMARGGDARRLEAPDTESLRRALATLQRSDHGLGLVALSAPVAVHDDVNMVTGFGEQALQLDEILDMLAKPVLSEAEQILRLVVPGLGNVAQGIDKVVVMDGCSADPQSRTAPVAPRAGMAVVLLPAPGGTCSSGDTGFEVLRKVLDGKGSLHDLMIAAGGEWVVPGAGTPPDLGSVKPQSPTIALTDQKPSATDSGPVMLGAAAAAVMPTTVMHAPAASIGGQAEVLVLSGGTQSKTAGAGVAALQPVAHQPASGVVNRRPGADVFRGLAAQAVAPGMPEPSIIVGNLRAPVSDAATDLGQASVEALGTGVEDRARIRADNPSLYAQLVEQGVFDPASDELPAAIQTELARLGCYRGGIDGAWGAGSRNGAEAYFRQAGLTSTADQPDTEMFRQIIGGPQVTCPAPVATPRANTSTPQRTTRGQQGQAPQAGGARAPANAAQANPPAQGGAAGGSITDALRGSSMIR